MGEYLHNDGEVTDLFAHVRQFVSQELRVKERKLREETTLQWDLGVVGDDGDDFFRAFSERFSVEVDFASLGEYFGSEGGIPNPCDILRGLLRLPERSELRPITLRDLVRAVQCGRFPVTGP